MKKTDSAQMSDRLYSSDLFLSCFVVPEQNSGKNAYDESNQKENYVQWIS